MRGLRAVFDGLRCLLFFGNFITSPVEVKTIYEFHMFFKSGRFFVALVSELKALRPVLENFSVYYFVHNYTTSRET